MGKKLIYKKGSKFVDANGKTIKDKKILEFAKSIYIAPAYRDVEIHPDPKDRILYIALDTGGKRQYFYKEFWHNKQDRKKFCNMIEFGRMIPKIKKDIDKLLRKKVWDDDKIIALQLKIMMLCNFRVGNLINGNKTKSTGISTLKRNHLYFTNGVNKPIEIRFIGKSNVENVCNLKDKKTITLIKELAKTKNSSDYLFVNKNGTRLCSKSINLFLKRYGENFSSKDFRTWVANTQFIKGIMEIGDPADSVTARKKQAKEAIRAAAEQLHHTAAICKKRYIYPKLHETYIENPTKLLNTISKTYQKKGPEEAFIHYMEKECYNS